MLGQHRGAHASVHRCVVAVPRRGPAHGLARRYLVAAHLINKGRSSTSNKWQSQLSSIKRIIASCEYQYSDPITDFVTSVYTDYDFERAQVRPSRPACLQHCGRTPAGQCTAVARQLGA